MLFLPTGAKDAPEYASAAETALKVAGAGGFEALFLTRNPSAAVVDRAFAAADLVYFGGGGAPLIVKHGGRYGLKERLRGVLARGGVVAGVSGGAIALFEGGAGAYNGYRPLPGWGLAPGGLLPHFHPGEEASAAPWFAENPGRVLYGLEDGSALSWEDGALTAVGNVWKLTVEGPAVLREAVV